MSKTIIVTPQMKDFFDGPTIVEKALKTVGFSRMKNKQHSIKWIDTHGNTLKKLTTRKNPPMDAYVITIRRWIKKLPDCALVEISD